MSDECNKVTGAAEWTAAAWFRLNMSRFCDQSVVTHQ